MTNHASTLERLSTGSAPLDAILGGGIPAGSVTVVAGEPGAGKTVFTLQTLFHHARQGKKCFYFTTLSEPALKIIRYMQLFSFFDARLVEERVVFADLGSTLRQDGAEKALTQIIQYVESEEPDLVAIDSFKAIHDLLPSAAHGRAFVYDLAVGMAAWGATTLLVGEYTLEDIGVAPEFAIADGIVRLSNEREALTTARQFEIVKMRGANYVTGRHFFEIGADGLSFYPRVRGPEMIDEPPVDLTERAATGQRDDDRGRHRDRQDACGPAFPSRRRAPEGAGDPLHAGGDTGADPGSRKELRLGPRSPGGSGSPPDQLYVARRARYGSFPR
jgi:circadian clock protein KaiC